MWMIVLLLLFLWQNMSHGAQIVNKLNSVTYLELGSIVEHRVAKDKLGFFEHDMQTYCYRGSGKSLSRLFESVELLFDIDNDEYTQYEGATPEEVREHYSQRRSLFRFNLFSQKRTRLQLSPFEQRCIGIESEDNYRVILKRQQVDVWRLLELILALILFTNAAKLSHNELFYYVTGIALGICSSFMLIIWLSSKLIPRRFVMYGALVSGWAIGIYFIQMIWENLQVIVVTYRTYVFWYIITAGLISFFFCYRWGPPRNQRSKVIIKWLLQLMSLALIYFSTQYEEAAVAIVIITCLVQYFPISLLLKAQRWYLRHFPPKRRFLTNEEYYEQGVRETTKALNELRNYARSPECKQWKLMSQLSDPYRFAAFVEGASHLRDVEILQFETFEEDDANIKTEPDSDELEDLHNQSNPSVTSRDQQNLTINQNRIQQQRHEDFQQYQHLRIQRQQRAQMRMQRFQHQQDVEQSRMQRDQHFRMQQQQQQLQLQERQQLQLQEQQRQQLQLQEQQQATRLRSPYTRANIKTESANARQLNITSNGHHNTSRNPTTTRRASLHMPNENRSVTSTVLTRRAAQNLRGADVRNRTFEAQESAEEEE